MSDYLSVSQCIEVLNATFEHLGDVLVEGEVAEFKVIHNKWVTFQLKDEESTLPCFMTVWQLRTQLEDGMLVRVSGNPKLREKGFFSFVVRTVVPTGEGALRRAFELLQQKLTAEGLFAQERKRPLPQFPAHVALITSPQAAAYSDFLKILEQRVGGITISFISAHVQGAQAVPELIAALETANTELKHLDAIVMVRGGGSLEDLQSFNDEMLVRAVAASRTPIIVGVGHERDITLAELAADVRASTPSNAAELLVRSREELLTRIEQLQSTLQQHVQDTLQTTQADIRHLTHALTTTVSTASRDVRYVIDAMHHVPQRLREHIAQTQENLTATMRLLTSLSPEKTLQRGYSITRRKDGSLLTKADQAQESEELVTQLANGEVRSRVTKIDL